MPLLTRQPASSHPLIPSGRHSLGGALATLAAYEAVHLCKRLDSSAGFPGASIQVYTYGAPRPGALACSMRGFQLSSSHLGSFKTEPHVKMIIQEGRAEVRHGTSGDDIRPAGLYLLAGNGAFARDLRATVPATFDVIHADDTIVRHGGLVWVKARGACLLAPQRCP